MRWTGFPTAIIVFVATMVPTHRAHAAYDAYLPVAYARPPRPPATPIPGTATRTPYPTAVPTLAVSDVRHFTNPNEVVALTIDERRDAVWTAGPGGIVRWSDASAANPAATVFDRQIAPFGIDISVGDDGTLWMPDGYGVERRSPAGEWQWLAPPLREKYPGSFLNDDLERAAADQDGGVWLAFRDGALRLKAGRAWEPARLGDPAALFETTGPVVAANGDVWFGLHYVTSKKDVPTGMVVRRADGRWEDFTDPATAPQIVDLQDFALGADGSVWAVGRNDTPEVALLRPNAAAFVRANLGDIGQTWWNSNAGVYLGDVVSIAVDAAGRPWLAGESGLVVPQDPDAKTWRAEIRENENAILDFELRPDGSAWMTTPLGLVRRSASGTYTPVRAPGLPANRARAVAVAADRVWVGTDAGLASIDASGRVADYAQEEGSTEGRINDVAVAGDGSVWLSMARDVGHRDAQGGWTWFDARSGLIDATAGPLAIGGDGSVWCIAGEPRVQGRPVEAQFGINHRRPDGRWRTFGIADGLPNLQGRSILVRRDGSVWAGFDGAQADSELPRDRFNLALFAPSSRWLGVQAPAAVRSEAIVALVEDSAGALWLLTHKGLARLSADGAWRTFEDEPAWRLRPSTENSTTETALAVDDAGNVYASSGGGLMRIRRDGTRAWIRDWLNGNDVADVALAADGRVWLAVAYGGVRSFRPAASAAPTALVVAPEQPDQHPAHDADHEAPQ